MSTSETSPQRAVGLVRLLAEEGDRLFTPARAVSLASRAGLSPGYARQALHHLVAAGWILHLKRGLYALSSSVFRDPPLHEYEVAMALVQPAAISHWSALHLHGLTDQIPRCVYVLTTNAAWTPRERGRGGGEYRVQTMRFKFVQVLPERFFGTQSRWVGDTQVTVTDPERTLLDALDRPACCGDFGEVLHAFELSRDRLDLPRIIEYARRLGATTAHRLGWVLEHVGIPRPEVEELAKVPIRGYRVVDPTGPRRGRCDGYWKIQENLG